jgi:predicted nucleic acid-binding protein
MSKAEWIVLDTNIWIFGLREHPKYPACSTLLHNFSKLFIKMPRHILRELQANLTKDELSDLFKLLNRYPENYEINWEKVKTKHLNKYLKFGCKLGDAAVAAHLEELNIKTFVSENRDFLSDIERFPFRVLNSEEAVKELLKAKK